MLNLRDDSLKILSLLQFAASCELGPRLPVQSRWFNKAYHAPRLQGKAIATADPAETKMQFCHFYFPLFLSASQFFHKKLRVSSSLRVAPWAPQRRCEGPRSACPAREVTAVETLGAPLQQLAEQCWELDRNPRSEALGSCKLHRLAGDFSMWWRMSFTTVDGVVKLNSGFKWNWHEEMATYLWHFFIRHNKL